MIDRAGGPPQQEWFTVQELEIAARRAIDSRDRYDVYFGVLPRTRREGTKDAIETGAVVWADIDSPGALAELLAFEVPPSAVVASGSPGCHHAYWPLVEQIAPERVEDLNRRLAARLGSDERVTDASRILRLPGTLNHKTDPATEVTLQDFTGERQPLDRLTAALPVSTADGHGTPSGPDADSTAAAVGPSDPVTNVLALLGAVRRGASGWTARCPAHDDEHPSLSVGQGADGRCLLRCHAGCTSDAIVAALGLRVIDLFPDRGSSGKGARDRLLDIIDREDVELFTEPGGRTYAKVPVGDHLETWSLDSQIFSYWLQHAYYRHHTSTAPGEALSQAISNFAARARFDGPERPVHRRVGGDLERLWVDIGDPAWTCIEVRNDATWTLREGAPIEFVREPGMLALPTTIRGGSIDLLRPLVNLPDDEGWIVFRGTLIASYHPTGPYFVAYLHGPGGSGKTEAGRRFARLVDPFSAQFLPGSASSKDVLVAAATCRLVGIDNMSQLTRAMSDTLCVISTGAGDRRRALYTNADLFSLQTKNPGLVIAMLLLATRGDLIDRMAPVRFERIDKTDRKPESALREQFAACAPAVLGGLMDAVAAALRFGPDVGLAEIPRMADATLFVSAAEHALGTPNGTFAETMVEEQTQALGDTIQSNPYVEAVVRFMADKPEWQGPATRLLYHADELAPSGRRSRDWPNNPSSASALLSDYELPLAAHGITFERDRTPGGGRERRLLLRNLRHGTAGTGGTAHQPPESP